jgi:hypothetical protein
MAFVRREFAQLRGNGTATISRHGIFLENQFGGQQ